MNNIDLKDFQPVPYSILAELRAQLSAIQEQNRVIMDMINHDQVARMSTEYLDLEEAAKVLHCKAKTLERLRMRGELPFSQYGKKIVIRRMDIDFFLDARKKNRDYLKKIESEPQLGFSDDFDGSIKCADGLEE